MTTFRFNFSGTNDSNEIQQKDKSVDNGVQWQESVRIMPKPMCIEDKVSHAKMFTCGDVEIGHIISSEIFGNGTLNGLDIAESKHSDLITGVYEGGLKIWECTHDLISFLEENKSEISLKDATVLDLGCGVGILGIYSFINGASVTFQDYNKEIIENVTIPNVYLNIEENSENKLEKENCQFYSGDWGSFNHILSDTTDFDVILTSETIYNIDNYDKLIDIFTRRLSKNGIVLVAAKTHYFGVGGGMRQFEDSINKCEQLESEVVWNSLGGVKREILKIRRKTE